MIIRRNNQNLSTLDGNSYSLKVGCGRSMSSMSRDLTVHRARGQVTRCVWVWHSAQCGVGVSPDVYIICLPTVYTIFSENAKTIKGYFEYATKVGYSSFIKFQ